MTSPFEYAPAPESRALVSIRSSYGLFIDGEFVSPADGRTFKTVDPSTEEVLAEVSEAGPKDVDRAVAAARRAYDDTWSRMKPSTRGNVSSEISQSSGKLMPTERKASPIQARKSAPLRP